MLTGYLLVAAALASGLAIGAAANPRAALAAHVIGITGGLLLIASGLVAPRLALPPALVRWNGAVLAGSVAIGFVVQWLGAAADLSRMFVVTAAGRPEGAPSLETVAEVATKGITPLTIVPLIVIAVGLWRTPAD